MSARTSALRALARCCARLGTSSLDPKLACSALQAPRLLVDYAPARRLFSTSKSVFSLSKVLQEELKYEQDRYQKPAEIGAGPPAPFVLEESPNDTLLTLKRSINGEEVAINLTVNNQTEQGFEDEEGENLSRVSFNVSVSKGDQSLVFECSSSGEDLVIEHVSSEPKSGIESDSVFTGPVFHELDERLQTEFVKYLETRGINSELGEYLRHLIFDKEQREYMLWLKKVKEFVEA